MSNIEQLGKFFVLRLTNVNEMGHSSSTTRVCQYHTLILEVVLYWTESHPCCAYDRNVLEGLSGRPDGFGDTEMMEITAVGMGLMMTGLAVALGGLIVEATFLVMFRALRTTPLIAPLEPASIHLS